jgi:hypothetical protein
MSEEKPPPQLDYESPPPAPMATTSEFAVRALGSITAIIGLIIWFSAYHGVDDRDQILLGIVITGFGITWWIMGVILRALDR